MCKYICINIVYTYIIYIYNLNSQQYGLNLSGAMNVVYVNVRHNVRQSRRVNGHMFTTTAKYVQSPFTM